MEVADVRVDDGEDGEDGDGVDRGSAAAYAGGQEHDTPPRRGFFGTEISHWRALASGGTVRARVRAGVNDDVENDGMRFDARFVCDVAQARAVRRLVGKDGETAPTRGERVVDGGGGGGGAGGGVMYDVICEFDGIDVSDVPRHTTMNVGAFEVIVRDGEGVERARGTALARVEQDDAGVLRRFVLPYKAVFE